MAVIISASKEVAALRDQLSSICDVPLSALELSSLHIALESESKSEISWTVGAEKDSVDLSREQSSSAWDALRFHLNLPALRAIRAEFHFHPGEVVQATVTFHPQTDSE